MGKLAQGTNIMKLFPGENIIKAFNIQATQSKDLVLVTNKNSFVKHNTKNIKISTKGELGTMGIIFKNYRKSKDRVINCFINNKHVYIKTDQNMYKKLETDQINNSLYKKEQKLNIELNNNEFIKSFFSMILPEMN